MALALATTLTLEALLGNGAGVALAETPSADQTASPEAVELAATPLEETPLEGEKTQDVEKSDAAEEADPVAVETWEWAGRTGNLALSSEGLTLDADTLDAALPEAVPGTLDLTLSLDPAADGTDTGNHTVVLPGDTLTVPLPEGVTVTGAALDVYQLDATGAPTALKVAAAEPVQDGAALRVTFVEPVDPATGAAYYVGAPTEGTVPAVQAEDAQQLAALHASVTLEVAVSSGVLGAEPSQMTWDLSAVSGDKIALSLPGTGEPAEEADPAPVADEPAPRADLTYEPVGATTRESLTMNWLDNKNADDKRPEPDAVAKELSMTFSLDDGEPLPLNEGNAEKYFDMSADDLTKIFSVRETGVGTYDATASGLPSQVQDSDGTTHAVTWSLSYDGSPDGYHRTQDGDGSLNFQLLATSTYKIVAKVGEEKLSTGSAPASDFVVIDGSDNEVPLSAVNEQPGWKGVWDAASGTYQLTAPAYGLDGLPIEYGLTYMPQTPGPTPDDGYTVSYDNAASTNHGSSTTAVYDGGIATILRLGTTTFDATKQWLDADDKQGKRPNGEEITLTLWRYSSNGDTAANAAQVTDASGSFVTLTATVGDVTENSEIDLGALLAEQYPSLVLEKYDNDGYAYYYGIREESSFAEYTTVYGKVDGDEVTDTAPNYDKKGQDEPAYDEDWTRDNNVDRLIYNNGTIGNRLSGQKTVGDEKEWHVAAFADQLNGVSCTLRW